MTNSKITIGITALCLFFIACIAVLLENISVNQSSTLEQMLPERDIALIDRYRALFEVESEPVSIAIRSRTPLTTARIARIEASLLALPAVTNSLSAASIGKFGTDGGQLFSPDATTGLIVLMIAADSRQLAAAKRLSEEIRQTLDTQLAPGESSLVAGLPQIREASWRIGYSDAQRVLPLLVLVTLVVTLLLFHSWAALALSLLLTSLTTCICLILLLVFSTQINALLVLVVPVIWAIATLDAFHLYSRTAIKTKQRHPHPSRAASRELFLPCLLTTATTAGCFLTLTLLDTSPLIVSFGIWGAVGAIVAFALTFTLGERLLSLQAHSSVMPRWPGRLALRMTQLAQRHKSITAAAWAALALCSIFSAPHITVATSFPQVFTPEQPIARDIDELQVLTGSDLNTIDVIVQSSDLHGEREESLASAALLTNNYLTTIDETRLVLPIGIMDEQYLKQEYERWQATHSTTEEADTATVNGLQNWVNTEHHAVRLQLHLAPTSYRRKEEIMDWLAHFDDTMLSHHTMALFGSGYFHHLTEKRGIASLLSSSLLSLVVIGAAMLWLTRGTITAAIALCGSLVPGAIIAGCMALFNIPWSIAMLPMPALLLGLMNDDTIHILWSPRANGRFDDRYFRRNAILAGPALLATTLVLSGAVATLLFSGIQTNQYLGILIPLGLLLALLCNLTLLPALSSLQRK